MKWLLALALLLGVPGLLLAQVQAPSGGFQLVIEAPDAVRQLLLRHLELMRYRELSDLTESELTRLLDSARQDAQDLVATLGYFSPVIRIERQTAGNPATPMVKLTVEPGDPTLVRAVDVEFSGPIVGDAAAQPQRQQMEANWSLQVGMRFTQAGWDSAKQQALRQLTTQRYPAGQIGTTLADIDPASHSARLKVTFISGPAYRLGTLLVSGNQRYSAELVRRLARLTPGADYKQSQLVAAQQRLTDSGYFASAFVSLDTSGDPQAAPVRVQLREALRQKLVLGVGASTDSGARLSVEHTDNQLAGSDWRAVSKLLFSRDSRAIGTDLMAVPDDRNWRWVTSALLQDQQTGSIEAVSERLRGGRSQSDERVGRDYYLQYDRADTLSTTTAVPLVAAALSVNYAFSVRNFDSLPFPSSGSAFGVELGGGTTLGSQRDVFTRVLARWLGYVPLGSGADTTAASLRAGRVVLRAEAGAVLAQQGANLPSTELFLAGGDKSVRGYGLRAIGVTLADGQTAAGRYLAVGSAEWQHPIIVKDQLSAWEGVLFVDAGAVADKPGDLQAKVGVGTGLRWKSPVGPLQIDLAYGVAVQSWRLHLNVGFTF